MTNRKAITPAMKIACLIYRCEVICSICSLELYPSDKIEWDHIHALTHGGGHSYANLRPVHADCHKRKTKADVQAKAKGDRILGLTCNGPVKKIPSRPFSKVHRPMRKVGT